MPHPAFGHPPQIPSGFGEGRLLGIEDEFGRYHLADIETCSHSCVQVVGGAFGVMLCEDLEPTAYPRTGKAG